jgi:thiamine biosynthesis lipoprotein ApbE
MNISVICKKRLTLRKLSRLNLTRYSVLELASAMVVAPNVKTADLLTTVDIIMGDNEGIKSIESLPGHKAFPKKNHILILNSRNNSFSEAVLSII